MQIDVATRQYSANQVFYLTGYISFDKPRSSRSPTDLLARFANHCESPNRLWAFSQSRNHYETCSLVNNHPSSQRQLRRDLRPAFGTPTNDTTTF